MRPALAAESLDLPVGSQSGFAKLRFANNSVSQRGAVRTCNSAVALDLLRYALVETLRVF